MYDSAEELLREIEAGEDSFLDFKEVGFEGKRLQWLAGGRPAKGRAAAEIAKDLSCFANTEGGVIVFGVRDDGERVGVDEERMDELQQFLVNVAQNSVEPPLGHLLLFDRVWLADRAGTRRLCLKLEIKKARWNVHAPSGRRPYWRIADQCHEMTLEQQARAFERRGLMSAFEERPLFNASMAALDTTRFAEYYGARYGHPFDEAQVSFEKLSVNLRLAAEDESGVLHPTPIGLLLFASEPQHFIPGAFVDLVLYESIEPDSDHQLDSRRIVGSLVEQIERVMDYFRYTPYAPVKARKDDRGRRDFPAYSLRALQEGVVNALVHRDYSITGSQVRVFLFPDRITISSPGRLPNSLVPEDLFAGCQPVRRNQMLAGFLRDYSSPLTERSYMEARGEGFLKLVRECEKLGARRPELSTIGDSVRLEVFAAHPVTPS